MNRTGREDACKVLAEGRHLDFVSRNGWEFVKRRRVSGIAVLVGVTDGGGLVLVSQWREPVGAVVVELPAGLAGDTAAAAGESTAAAARRELLEETGFVAERVEAVLEGPPSAGVSNEVVTLYYASGLHRVGRGGGEPGEGVRAHVVPLRRLEEWLRRMERKGCLIDPKVWAGAYLAQTRRMEQI